MSRKQTIVVAAFAFVVIIGVLIGVFYENNQLGPENQSFYNKDKKQVNTNIIPEAPIEFSSEVPKNATTSKSSIEIPIINKPTGNDINAYKIFTIQVSKNGYNPSEITIQKGNVVEFQLSSNGGDFDMFSSSAGFYVVAKNGVVGKITFTPSEVGTYLFSCRDYCPSGEKISGQLIVLP